MDSIYPLTFGITILTFAVSHLWRTSRGKKSSLPPSPPADSLIGHLRLSTIQNPELLLHQWAREFGEIFHTKLFGQPTIVLNSVRAVTDLLEKRSLNYSDRPDCVVYKLLGWTSTITFLQNGDQFKNQRRLFQRYFSGSKAKEYQALQKDEARILIDNMLRNPDGHDKHLQRFSASIVIRIAYGHPITSDDDEYNILITNVVAALGAGGPPGGTAVDFFPFLQYMPSWFPGTHFAGEARRFRKYVRDLHERPVEQIRQQMAAGTAIDCVVKRELEKLALNPTTGAAANAQFDDIIGVAGAIYAAGSDTTWSTMSVFLLAMVLNPDVQRKAQEEIDSVIGSRLPDFTDRDQLPYVNYVVQETFRWHPAVPLGVPHRTSNADTYNGMDIPKGALVIGNAWTITHDPDTYDSPDSFNPSRFLPKPEGNGEPLPVGVFGFGRRVCPGQYVADNSVWIGIVTILSQLDISRAIDENGREIIPKAEFKSSISSHPKEYQCRIRARHAKA